MYSFIRVPSCVKGRASDSQGTRIPTWWSRQWQWKGVGWDVFCPGAGLSKPSWGASNQSGVETKLLTVRCAGAFTNTHYCRTEKHLNEGWRSHMGV